MHIRMSHEGWFRAQAARSVAARLLPSSLLWPVVCNNCMCAAALSFNYRCGCSTDHAALPPWNACPPHHYLAPSSSIIHTLRQKTIAAPPSIIAHPNLSPWRAYSAASMTGCCACSGLFCPCPLRVPSRPGPPQRLLRYLILDLDGNFCCAKKANTGPTTLDVDADRSRCTGPPRWTSP